MNGNGKTPQISLILRLFGGGYLLYLAWGLFRSESTLYMLIAAFFALVGASLLLYTLREISNSGPAVPPPSEDGESEINEENFHEES